MLSIDTHCHLNFEVFRENVGEVIECAHAAGVEKMVVVGTTLSNSARAVELASFNSGVYAAVGVHPHKVFDFLGQPSDNVLAESVVDVVAEVTQGLESLIEHDRVVAVGEIGFDRWTYPKTSYKNYQVTEEFLNLQSRLFDAQLDLAYRSQKPVIFHNRLAATDLLEGIERFTTRGKSQRSFLQGNAVFHCCESDRRLLDFAARHGFFIGVAGDVTYDSGKQDFVRQVPKERLLLETDSPFLKPFQAKSGVCEPSDLLKIAQTIANLYSITVERLTAQTHTNSQSFFNF